MAVLPGLFITSARVSKYNQSNILSHSGLSALTCNLLEDEAGSRSRHMFLSRSSSQSTGKIPLILLSPRSDENLNARWSNQRSGTDSETECEDVRVIREETVAPPVGVAPVGRPPQNNQGYVASPQLTLAEFLQK